MAAQTQRGIPDQTGIPNQTAEKLLSIGQVLTKLSSSFPDLTPSKLRFLEEQGLITPKRTESGYRKFTISDVERVRFVLGLQRDRYLPLKVIKKYLDEVDAGENPVLPGLVTPVASSTPTPSFVNRDELILQTGMLPAQLNDCISMGLIPAGERFSNSSVAIAQTLVTLSKYGIEPRHLRGFKATIDREVGLIESILAPITGKGGTEGKAKTAQVAEDLAEQLSCIQTEMLAQGISHLTT